MDAALLTSPAHVLDLDALRSTKTTCAHSLGAILDDCALAHDAGHQSPPEPPPPDEPPSKPPNEPLSLLEELEELQLSLLDDE